LIPQKLHLAFEHFAPLPDHDRLQVVVCSSARCHKTIEHPYLHLIQAFASRMRTVEDNAKYLMSHNERQNDGRTC
jgi:hypothetical protein